MSRRDRTGPRQAAWRAAWLGLLVLCADPTVLAQNGSAHTTIQFPLQSTELNPVRAAAIAAFLEKNGAQGYYLLQGFACDTGGFEASRRVAQERGRNSRALLLDRGLAPDHVWTADAVVLTGEPRTAHRRLELYYFANLSELRQSLAGARTRAARANDSARILLQRQTSPGGDTTVGTPTMAPGEGASLWWLLVLGLVILLLALVFYFLRPWLAERKRARHQLAPEEAEALHILTGGGVQPVVVETVATPVVAVPTNPANQDLAPAAGAVATAGGVREFMQRRAQRSEPMGSQKKKTDKNDKARITPISIRGAVDREFENRGLAELAKSPINALEGLTPRHARMLDEAFGIKTVEDLAQLRYVEIARAIVVLSRFETR